MKVLGAHHHPLFYVQWGTSAKMSTKGLHWLESSTNIYSGFLIPTNTKSIVKTAGNDYLGQMYQK